MIEVPVSIGELIDKITILEIKNKKIADKNKLININKELTVLNSKLSSIPIPDEVFLIMDNLRAVNLKLWEVEDYLRELEKLCKFDSNFVENARSVYILNDERFSLKRQINHISNSIMMEEKSYD